MGKNVMVWSPVYGDLMLTAALLEEILGSGEAGSIVSTPISTAGAGVLTAAGLVGGQIARTGPSAAYTDTTATAAAIVTALGGFVSGMTFVTRIKNATKYFQTLAAGTGVTLPSGVIVPPMGYATYFGTVGGTEASPTVTFTHMSTTAIYEPGVRTNEQSSALATVGAGTILAASMIAGITARGGTQIAAFTDTTDTAAALLAASSALGTIVGSAMEYTYINNTTFPATIAAGVGVTLSGVTVVPARSWVKYLLTYTAAGAVSMVAIAQGYFPKVGVTPAANGATPVAVTDAAVTDNSIITLTPKTVGGTPHGAFVSAVTPGVGFSINSLAGDTTTYTYEIRG